MTDAIRKRRAMDLMSDPTMDNEEVIAKLNELGIDEKEVPEFVAYRDHVLQTGKDPQADDFDRFQLLLKEDEKKMIQKDGEVTDEEVSPDGPTLMDRLRRMKRNQSLVR